MTAFLFKSEPFEDAFADLARDGRAVWEGVTNARLERVPALAGS